jgi:hypothetical protein
MPFHWNMRSLALQLGLSGDALSLSRAVLSALNGGAAAVVEDVSSITTQSVAILGAVGG